MPRQARHVLAALLLAAGCLAAQVKRVVIIKVDGVPQDLLARELQRTDTVTGKSTLPWIDRVFVQGGTRLENFYVRGISLSAPSWSMLDTGRHLEIKGNAEFDRYTYHVHDYLNFFPFYLGYALSRRVDMPGVEVLDESRIPLLIDYFPYQERYQSFQLYQRGVRWKTLQHSLQSRFTTRSLRDLLDEWTIGFEIGSSIETQTEMELIRNLSNPQIRYLDFFTGDFDHVAHSTPDLASQRLALQRIDSVIGRVWSAIESSPAAANTMLVMVSDHGMNTQPGVYSQGYDLVSFFNSRAGGAHHVVTDRHPLTEFKLRGLDPFVSEVVTPSEESLYLKGAGKDYPTALLDLDGNERASVYLRNSSFNALHILLQELDRNGQPAALRSAVIAGFLQIVDQHRPQWQAETQELQEELAAVHRSIEALRIKDKAEPSKWSKAQRDAGADKESRRLSAELEWLRDQEQDYTAYAGAMEKLLALTAADLQKRHFSPSDLIPKHAMGDLNSPADLRNYIVGPGVGGVQIGVGGSLDFERSFRRVDYLPLLTSLAVKNSVQADVGPNPVDFIAMRIPKATLEDSGEQDPIWLYRDGNHQAVILSRHDAAGTLELRYVPLSGQFQHAELGPGFPLQLFEDTNLLLTEDRGNWLSAWHSEFDWLRAVHKTRYSNGIIGLEEQFWQTPAERDGANSVLMNSFRAHVRRLAEPDFIVFASDHWNFNVRGFNPGGNHGSLLRISTHSVLMLAGGAETKIPHGLAIEEPYDSLSFVPTILDMMGLQNEAKRLPGRAIRELAP